MARLKITMEAKITLSKMRFYSSHGCYQTEQRVGGRFTVDLWYTYNAAQTIATDDVAKAVNYLDIYAEVRQQMSIPSHTIEHASSRIAQALLDRFDIMESVGITLTKVTPPLGGDIEGVSVTLTQTRTIG